jgi:small subunit ribosomal protein S6
MRHYETVFIADPDLPADVQTDLFDKARTLINDNDGELIEFDEWGNKRLAYEIRKKQRGHYIRLDYCGSGATVSTLENAFRIDERILKFMTILVNEEADPEQLKAAVEAKQASETTEEKSGEGPTEAAAETATETAAEATEAPDQTEPKEEKADSDPVDPAESEEEPQA